MKVRSNLIRLPADVLIALDYRYYTSFPSFFGQDYVDGVQFYTLRRTEDNQLSRRGTSGPARRRIRRYRGRFRPVVRVAKNARNALIADDEIAGHRREPRRLTSLSPCCGMSLTAVMTGTCARRIARSSAGCTRIPSKLAGWSFPNEMGKLFGEAPDAVWNESDARAIISAMHLQLNS